MAKLTLLGMYNFQKAKGIDLFSDIKLPEAIDSSILINQILVDSAEFGLIYPNGDYMKNLIQLFFEKHYLTFNRWITALNTEYNPLENYDRNEEWKDNRESNLTTNTQNTSSGTNENKVSAFNESSYSPESYNIDSNTTIGTSYGNTSDDSTHTGRTHGNIGVTTSQQMLEAELNVVRFNIYEEISSLFCEEFCVMIY